MLSRRPPRGFTLIEMMIVLVVSVLLLLAGAPSWGTWIADARVRSTAEALQNGLRLAQSEAVQRNRASVFALTAARPAWNARPQANGRSWLVQMLPLADSDEAASPSQFVQGNAYASQAGIDIDGPALLCFGPLGRQLSLSAAQTGLGAGCDAPPDADSPTTYTVSKAGASRTLRVTVHAGGRVRMCDAGKTLSNNSPEGC